MKCLLVHINDVVSWRNSSSKINDQIQLLILSLAGNKFDLGQIIVKNGTFVNPSVHHSVFEQYQLLKAVDLTRGI